MAMISGKLRHRVTIQQASTVEDTTSGGTYEQWTNEVTVWGQVTPASGREFWDIRKSNSEVDGKVTIRYRPGLDPTRRLLHKGRVLEILYIINRDERNEMLEIYYREAQA
jgi:SPP1 family predicted phage head-tail adaptor